MGFLHPTFIFECDIWYLYIQNVLAVVRGEYIVTGYFHLKNVKTTYDFIIVINVPLIIV